ncbi:Bifunctional polymyxin resistance protein ArnA [compost metagenome]
MSSHVNGQAFNIGSEHSITIVELAHKIRHLTGSSSQINFVPYAQVYGPGYEDMPIRIPDISRARRFLQYEPSVSLDDGLQISIDWFKQQLLEGRL